MHHWEAKGRATNADSSMSQGWGPSQSLCFPSPSSIQKRQRQRGILTDSSSLPKGWHLAFSSLIWRVDSNSGSLHSPQKTKRPSCLPFRSDSSSNWQIFIPSCSLNEPGSSSLFLQTDITSSVNFLSNHLETNTCAMWHTKVFTYLWVVSTSSCQQCWDIKSKGAPAIRRNGPSTLLSHHFISWAGESLILCMWIVFNCTAPLWVWKGNFGK